jgi:hypothetical protein
VGVSGKFLVFRGSMVSIIAISNPRALTVRRNGPEWPPRVLRKNKAVLIAQNAAAPNYVFCW